MPKKKKIKKKIKEKKNLEKLKYKTMDEIFEKIYIGDNSRPQLFYRKINKFSEL